MKPGVMDKVDFKNVGGLEEHIRALKEMVIFPLMYRDIYDKFHIKPPRGVLFYGPPGTGKTLVARALANECNRCDRKVSFFSRKGAECLCKWVGESEKILRKLFESAQQSSPSIIFFDEIDGLTPIRSSQHDQVHTSLVSTMLALMDGLDTLTDVIVIGATNRIDAIDPALRRPGRFDRELYFSPPAVQARRDILHVYMDQWNSRPNDGFIDDLASNTVGYCGSDLHALCCEAVMCGVRRQFPQLYTAPRKIRIDSRTLEVESCDFLQAKTKILPAVYRNKINPAKKLSNVIYPLLWKQLEDSLNNLKNRYPFKFLESQRGSAIEVSVNCFPRLLITGEKFQGHTSHLAPAILHHFEHLPVHTLDLIFLMERSEKYHQELVIQKFKDIRDTLPGAILYMPDIACWWSMVEKSTTDIFFQLLNFMQDKPFFLLATANTSRDKLDASLQNLFNTYQGQVIKMENPTDIERMEFFRSLFTTNCIIPPPDEENSHGDDAQTQPKSVTNVPRTRCSRRLRGEKAEEIELAPPPKRMRRNRSKEEQNEVPCLVRIKQEPLTPKSSVDNIYEQSSQSDSKVVQEFDKFKINLKQLIRLQGTAVEETEGFGIDTLEIFYGGLSNIILSYQRKSDRSQLCNDLDANIKEFAEAFKVKPNNTTPEEKSNNTTPEVKSNNTTPEVKSNNTTPEVKSNNTTPEVKSNNTTPEVKSNNTMPHPSQDGVSAHT